MGFGYVGYNNYRGFQTGYRGYNANRAQFQGSQRSNFNPRGSVQRPAQYGNVRLNRYQSNSSYSPRGDQRPTRPDEVRDNFQPRSSDVQLNYNQQVAMMTEQADNTTDAAGRPDENSGNGNLN